MNKPLAIIFGLSNFFVSYSFIPIVGSDPPDTLEKAIQDRDVQRVYIHTKTGPHGLWHPGQINPLKLVLDCEKLDKKDLEIINLLLEAGYPVAESALAAIASKYGELVTDYAPLFKVIETIVSQGTSIDAYGGSEYKDKKYEKRSALMYAAQQNNKKLVRFLLESGANAALLSKPFAIGYFVPQKAHELTSDEDIRKMIEDAEKGVLPHVREIYQFRLGSRDQNSSVSWLPRNTIDEIHRWLKKLRNHE